MWCETLGSTDGSLHSFTTVTIPSLCDIFLRTLLEPDLPSSPRSLWVCLLHSEPLGGHTSLSPFCLPSGTPAALQTVPHALQAPSDCSDVNLLMSTVRAGCPGLLSVLAHTKSLSAPRPFCLLSLPFEMSSPIFPALTQPLKRHPSPHMPFGTLLITGIPVSFQNWRGVSTNNKFLTPATAPRAWSRAWNKLGARSKPVERVNPHHRAFSSLECEEAHFPV